MKKSTTVVRQMHCYIVAIPAILLSYALPCWASEAAVVDNGNLPIQLSEPLVGSNKLRFGDGWAKAYVHTLNGEYVQLFPQETLTSTGGIVFEDFDHGDISFSGNYVVVPLVRQGTLNFPGGKSQVEGREYCPVVDTRNGCVISMQTGEICGGQWSPNRDAWIDENIDRTPEMLTNRTMTATILWEKFSHLRENAKIRDLVKENLSIFNTLICDPVNDKNKKFYVLIASQLNREGDLESAKLIDRKLLPGLIKNKNN